jgi:hypothetical protein
MIPKAAAPAQLPIPAKRTPLASVKPQKIEAPWRILLHGQPGIGKTTFGAAFPDPVFLCAERAGADELSVARYPDPVTTFDELREAVRRLTLEEHAFKSLIIDTLDDLEPLIWAEVVRRDGKAATIEDVGGGFQKGYNAAVDDWRILLAELEHLQTARGMHLLLIAHTTRREFKAPDSMNYDRWEPNIHRKAAGLLASWSKEVLFAQEETATTKLDGKNGKAKGISTGVRLLRTRMNAVYDAKNRHSLPDPLPLDFGAFVEAMKAHRVASPEELKKLIAEKLAVIDNRMSATLEQRRAKGS